MSTRDANSISTETVPPDALRKVRELGGRFAAYCEFCGPGFNYCGNQTRRVEMTDHNKTEPFVGTISELLELLGKSIESWDDVQKAIFRAGTQGRLSSQMSE